MASCYELRILNDHKIILKVTVLGINVASRCDCYARAEYEGMGIAGSGRILNTLRPSRFI